MISFANVTVGGQNSYSYPSTYVNYRNNPVGETGNFVTGETDDGKTIFNRTYMVGGYRRRSDWNGNEQGVVVPMVYSQNGKETGSHYQEGDKKKQ